MTGSPGRWTRSPRSWTRSPARLGAAAISEFGVDVARLHWDMTSISLYGAYPDPDGEYPAPRWGHPKDRRPDLKQIQTGLAVSGDGGIPVFHRAYDGGAGEVAQVAGAMTALKKIAGPRTFLLVGDSKLISYANAAAMNAQGSRVRRAAGRLPGAGRAVRRPAGRGGHRGGLCRRAGRGQARRRAGQLPGGRKTRPGWTCAAPAKPTRWCTCAGSWCTPRRTPPARPRPGRPSWPRPPPNWTSWYAPPGPGSTRTPSAVAARVQAIAARRRAGKYLRTAITAGPAGKPVLAWHFDQDAIDAEAAADGWYALLTNLEPGQAGPEQVFRRYKGQHAVERRYGEFKGPLAVAPLFLKTNRRITALITVICLALLIFCLAERQVRKALAPHAEMMTGLPGYGRTPARPTGRTIFQALADLRLIPAHDGNPATIPKPAGVQARLLDLLDIDISRPRWLIK